VHGYSYRSMLGGGGQPLVGALDLGIGVGERLRMHVPCCCKLAQPRTGAGIRGRGALGWCPAEGGPLNKHAIRSHSLWGRGDGE
jgi:hypothetical protein